MKKASKTLLIITIAVIGSCLMFTVLTYMNNLSLPQASAEADTLSQSELIRLEEFFQLRRTIGGSVWSGWNKADLPVIVYNDGYAFLLGYSDKPPKGWLKLPAGTPHGTSWQILKNEQFDGQFVYTQHLFPGIYPENFAVRVGESWVSSLQTREWMEIQLTQTIRSDLPGFLRPIFPYQLFTKLMLGGDDKYISALAHESFHAWQGLTSPEKFAAAENAARLNTHYPWEDETLSSNWRAELELLADILRAKDTALLTAQTRRFLELRAARRNAANLAPELIAYEQQREWLEGLARYAELEIWRQGSLPGYQPLLDSTNLPNFDRYQTFETRWQQEIDQMPRMFNDEGDGRFYYSGMAQAYLLDRLMPDWKEHAFEDGTWLESLLTQAVMED